MNTDRTILMTAVARLFCVTASAQEFPTAGLGWEYSFASFYPSQTYTQRKNPNGGGGSLVVTSTSASVSRWINRKWESRNYLD